VVNLSPTYDLRLVAGSLAIASFAAYVALDLAKRVRGPDGRVARHWWLGGSVAMGLGIWCMHFVGMIAFSLPIVLGYTVGYTVTSLGAAIAVSGVALYHASRETLQARNLLGGALAMGAGICTMHYTGMAALDMAPGIAWDVRLVAASALIAVVASAAALLIFFWMRRVDPERMFGRQAAAALVMGLAICGMHYTGMAAAGFREGSVCLSSGALGGSTLSTFVVVSSLALLAITLITSQVDARAQARTSGLNAQLRVANEQLQRHAFVDPLTGLPNRLQFDQRLHEALNPGRRSVDGAPPPVAILFIDLDGFKPINDMLGHAVGDDVLRIIARRLAQGVRGSDTIARVGGDEFVMLLVGDAGTLDAAQAARRLIEVVSRPFEAGGRRLRLSCSIGIALHPEHGPPERLLAHADAAMYASKRTGGNGWAFYEPQMDTGHEENLGLHIDLRDAVELGQLSLHYQPKVCGSTGGTLGVEALVRWRHPTRGMIGPLVFIPLAERYGLVDRIGHWVVDEACRQIAAWAREGMRMHVAINLSAQQLRDAELVDRVCAALARHGVAPEQLLCEITESVAMGDVDATQQAFDGLAAAGVMLSIDDFGTGYSSLSYLRRLPARQLKIDRSFVSDLETSVDARAIVSAVIHLAHDLGLRVVAEGVETQGQREVLVGHGCDELQGYLFAKPMPAEEVLGWMRARDVQPGELVPVAA
jgi:diguanylate cyclase (GGDEF)-like protein